jgi:hypothetical protein
MFIVILDENNIGINGTKNEISKFANELLKAVLENSIKVTFGSEIFGETNVHLQITGPAEAEKGK